MRFAILVSALWPLAGLAGSTPTDAEEAAAAKKVLKFQKEYQKNVLETIKHRKTGCTEKKLLRRQEWGSLSKNDRLSYIDAVYCLATKTALTPPSELPGARSRYDDFTGSHLFQTPFVHNDGLFLGYHRYFVHLYEKALREECGYKGAQPYWDWTLSYKDPSKSTVFDGSPWSLGSNGVYIPNRPPTVIPFVDGSELVFPPATSGGCVYSGPFTPDKFQLHLGPVVLVPQGPLNGTGYNPRCLTRDLSPVYSGFTRPTNVSDLISEPKDLAAFNLELDSSPQGLHGAGHFQVGGIEMDVFTSPGDPIFWLHHAQVDRLWAIWQGQDLEGRTKQVWGTVTSGNFPPSENATLDSIINFGAISGPKKLGEVVSSIDGELCYIYE